MQALSVLFRMQGTMRQPHSVVTSLSTCMLFTYNLIWSDGSGTLAQYRCPAGAGSIQHADLVCPAIFDDHSVNSVYHLVVYRCDRDTYRDFCPRHGSMVQGLIYRSLDDSNLTRQALNLM